MLEELKTKTLKIFVTLFLGVVEVTNPRTQHPRQDPYILNYSSDFLQLLQANARAVPSADHENFQIVIHKSRTPEWASRHADNTVQ